MEYIQDNAALLVGYAVLGLMVLGFVTGIVMRGLNNTIKFIFVTVGWVFRAILVAYPGLLFALGWSIPSQQELVTSVGLPEASREGTLLLFMIGGSFIMVEILAAQFATRAFDLVFDLLSNTAWAVGLALFVGYEYGRNSLQFFEQTSATIAILAAFVGGAGYVIGAWNKNPTQVARGALS